ncbi:efflux transporter outer membrane subunit [Cloacibacillus evryensis]|uniref:efflux transporter outer membrane subunit n=1 Tax=Cloacibacillus evryensis TaxID=508460 RepID=UPI00210E2B40|nr:efflux transporter outer membrane subunit [Cloacibacillus evryensis]MCQ4762628.1 efflux transporter outer membrane subunit [Cloacibacillus evryensis]
MNFISKCTAAVMLMAAAAGAAMAAPGAKNELPSADIRLKEVSWTKLAGAYPIPAVSPDISSALTPERLASWWDAFGDPQMTALVKRSLENNRTLAAARARVTEARASLGVSRAALLPWLGSTGFWNNGRTPVEAGGSGNGGSLYKLGLDASWEIDVFGGQRAKVEAQRATLEAQYAALYSAWTSLAAETAMDYISLRTLQERLAIAGYNLGLQKSTVELQQSKVDSGLSDSLALKQAQYTMEQTKAMIPNIEAAIEQTMNALAVLTGEIPGTLEEELAPKKPIPRLDGLEYIGIPANTIRQRPDIRQAERLLVAQLARKKSAQADLWPKLYLTGSIGTEAGNWGSLFGGPAKLYSFMPQISWPIFHAGAIRSNIKAQGAIAEQLLASYEQTVLSAVGEVRDSLSANVKEYERSESLRRGVEAAQAALDVANDKYANGLVDFTNVINAQRSLTSLSEEYVISQGQISANAVALFKALGGGWQPMEEAERALAEAAKKAKK